MKITVASNALFLFKINLPQAELLLKLSSTHYDGVCVSAGAAGGFLYGWWNQVLSGDTQGVEVGATWRNLDITLKIMEMADFHLRWKHITEDQMREVWRLRKAFMCAMSTYTEASKNWKLEVEEE